MLTTKEAIVKRRSIRRFKPDAVSPEILDELINSALLAPSGGNAQPWKFKIVKDQAIKNQLASAAYNQNFIATAPVIIVVCVDTKDYANNIALGAKHLGEIHAVEQNIVTTVVSWSDFLRSLSSAQLGSIASISAAIAIEHIMLRALDYGLGSCWVTADAKQVNHLFSWEEDRITVALIPIGYPAEDPKPRKRKSLSEAIL